MTVDVNRLILCSAVVQFLAHNAFVRTNCRTIAMVFVHLSTRLGWACIVIIQCILVRI